jgi:hypothetical protein
MAPKRQKKDGGAGAAPSPAPPAKRGKAASKAAPKAKAAAAKSAARAANGKAAPKAANTKEVVVAGAAGAAAILKTKALADGSTLAVDQSYSSTADGKRAVKPQSLGADKGKAGEATTGHDVDLSAKQRAQLAEKGILDDLVCTPWAIIRPAEIGGSFLNEKESGFSCYIVTLAKPTKKNSGRILCPTKITTEEFMGKLRLGHMAYGVSLQKMCARRERPRDHEHLHCVVSAGDARQRYRWKRIAEYCRATWFMFLNFTTINWASGVLYLSQGSSRKYEWEFVEEPMLWFAPGVEEQSIEEICHGSGHSDVKVKKMDFIEFREFIEQNNVKDIAELHRCTRDNPKLDRFVNDVKQSVAAKWSQAQSSIQMRNSRPTTLLKEFLRASTKYECVCGQRTVQALRDWSKGIDWPGAKIKGKPVAKGEFAAGFMIMRWGKLGRVPGNTLCFVGPTGTGKSWIISLMKAALDFKMFYAAPKGKTNFPFEALGWLLPLLLAFLLDEFSTERMLSWLGERGWWKLWLDLQTDPVFVPSLPKNEKYERTHFSEPAPIVYSATYPIRLRVGDDGFTDYAKVCSENEQQSRRETQGVCSVCVDRGLDENLPTCAKCFGDYLWLCHNHYTTQKTSPVDPKVDVPSPAKKRNSMG